MKFPGPLTALCLLLLLAGGCAVARVQSDAFPRPFEFGRDSFAFSNELFWTYQIDPVTGKTYHHWRQPGPDYAQHCFVVARAARQFFQFARFDASLPATDEPTYRRLVRRVVRSDLRREVGPSGRVLIPGFADLHQFSAAYEELLKAECGSMWQSYFQRGHWRMVFPFSARHQGRMSDQLVESIRRNRPPVVHIAHFPRLQINHALLLYDARRTGEGWAFKAYDPNFATTPSLLEYREATGRFFFPPQSYFAGGIVDVYEVYHRWNY